MRTGIIARKLGSSRIFTEEGGHIPVTLLQVESCQVVSHKTQDQHGYDALQIGAGESRPSRVSKAMRGLFSKVKVIPKKKLVEFRISNDAFVDIGSEIGAGHFVTGQRVDVLGTSLGKGFAGPMKRHNFGGLRATHGVSISHRSHGSTGHCQEPGKVFKGKKMAGHMGDAKVTVQNLEVVSVDSKKGLIIVKGAVPGAKGGWGRVSDAVKGSLPDEATYPEGLASDSSDLKPQVDTEATDSNNNIDSESTDEASNSDVVT